MFIHCFSIGVCSVPPISRLCDQPFAILGRLDGDASIGFRLYKDVQKFDTKKKVQGKENSQETNIQWETIATSLEEFRRVVVRNNIYFNLVAQP